MWTAPSHAMRHTWRRCCCSRPGRGSYVVAMARPWRPDMNDVDRLSKGGAAKRRGTGSFHIPHRLNSDERPVYEAAKKKVCGTNHSAGPHPSSSSMSHLILPCVRGCLCRASYKCGAPATVKGARDTRCPTFTGRCGGLSLPQLLSSWEPTAATYICCSTRPHLVLLVHWLPVCAVV